MPAIRTVSNIKSNLLRPALTSAFEVELAIPNALRRDLGTVQDKLNLMCCEAVLPGSQIATLELRNDHTGVTERHAHRRVFDDRIDLTFYVDAKEYLPIRFFEAWIDYITSGQSGDFRSASYSYRMRYPDGDNGYTATGLKVVKFERDHQQRLQYEFIKVFPLAINSMPIMYDASSLLKCTVSLTYLRYIADTGRFYDSSLGRGSSGGVTGLLNSLIESPLQQSIFNTGGLSGVAAKFVDAVLPNQQLGANDLIGTLSGFS